MKAVGQLGIRIAAGGEAGTIRLSEGADQCVAVLAADLAVLRGGGRRGRAVAS